jgi:L-aspartate oxidase
LNNLVLTGRLVAEAAIAREESRGAHFRSDFPQHSAEWEKHITFTR